MVLVRLQGCGVGCPFCDTKETWAAAVADRVDDLDAALGTNPRWCEVDAPTLARAARSRFPGPAWALVTGGEPAEQDLGPLVRALHAEGFRVALETSGTASGHVGVGFDWICVSPKVGMPGGREILPDAVAAADEIKHVVGRPSDLAVLDSLLIRCPTKRGIQVCLQPMSLSPRATELCEAEALRRGWRLSVQLHRLLGRR